jgi:hypothetical protein
MQTNCRFYKKDQEMSTKTPPVKRAADYHHRTARHPHPLQTGVARADEYPRFDSMVASGMINANPQRRN